jgi:hypothetical protein
MGPAIASIALVIWLVPYIGELIPWTSTSGAEIAAEHAVLAPWWIGIGITLLIYVHELGHFALATRKGYRPRWPLFLPFVGALTGRRAQPTPADDAWIALAGVFTGFVGSGVPFALYASYGSHSLWFILQVWLYGNLFTLIPSGRRDGSVVMHALDRSDPSVVGQVSGQTRIALRSSYLALIAAHLAVICVSFVVMSGLSAG